MRKSISAITMAFILATCSIHAQGAWQLQENVHNEEEPIFCATDVPPQFPGGDTALLQYVSQHVIYPSIAPSQESITGRVVVSFVVTKTGEVGEVKVIRQLSPEFDQEAVRVVKSLPKFSPGRKNGKVVNTWYTLPITFRTTR